MSNFYNDLEREKKNEADTARAIAGFFNASGIYHTTGRDSSHDYSMMISGQAVTFEQKTDYYTKPGHPYIFVEIASANRNCPAGVSVTTAKYLTYNLPNLQTLCIFKTEPFKEYFFAHSGEYRHVPHAGDGAEGFVVPLNITGEVPCRVYRLGDAQ